MHQDNTNKTFVQKTAKTIANILNEVGRERVRQLSKWGEQNHPDGTRRANRVLAFFARLACDSAAKGGSLTWLDILREETEEAAAETDPAKLRAELVQVAAVCAAWIEAIDRRTKHP